MRLRTPPIQAHLQRWGMIEGERDGVHLNGIYNENNELVLSLGSSPDYISQTDIGSIFSNPISISLGNAKGYAEQNVDDGMYEGVISTNNTTWVIIYDTNSSFNDFAITFD